MAKRKTTKNKRKETRQSVKRTRGKEETKKNNNDAIGIFLITVGILMLLSIFSKYVNGLSMGRFGGAAYQILTSIFGIGAFIVPCLVMAIGYMYIISKNKVKYSRKFFGIILIVINIMILLNIFKYDIFYNPPNMKLALSKIYDSGTPFHGGIIAFLLTVPLCTIFGKTGGLLIVFAGFLIGGICITEMEIQHMFSTIISYISSFKPDKSKRVSKADEKEITSDVEKNTYEKDNISNNENRIKIIDFVKSNTLDETAVTENENKNEAVTLRETDIVTDENTPIIKDSMEQKEVRKKTYQHEKQIKSENIDNIEKDVKEEIFTNAIIHDSEKKEYIFPSIELLKENKEGQQSKSDKRELLQDANKLASTLKSFGVKAKVVQVTKGPSVTRFEIQPEVGVKVSKIVNLSDDIALNLAAPSIRIEAPIPGKAAVGIEVPNKKLLPVLFREIIDSSIFQEDNGNLTIGLGKDIAGKCITTDLAKMPHVLVAGATGSGKSVCINSLIISLLYKYTPEDVKLLMIDPKVVELNVYNGIPHLLIPVVTDSRKAAGALSWAVGEMERRYQAFADNGVKNIEGYNELYSKGIIEEKMPFIVIIIDELADLMMVAPKDVEGYIARLAQKARASGMHLVIATQRPSVDVITGMIKANIPSRIAFAVSSQVDSRTIIDSSGAEKLLGKGDMLFLPIGASKATRIQGAFISEKEVEEVVNFIKVDQYQNEYKEDIIEAIDNNIKYEGDEKTDADPLLNEAIEFVLIQQKASTSMLQRKFKVGYNRAARIIDEMEERGVISGANGSKPRQILMCSEDVD